MTVGRWMLRYCVDSGIFQQPHSLRRWRKDSLTSRASIWAFRPKRKQRKMLPRKGVRRRAAMAEIPVGHRVCQHITGFGPGEFQLRRIKELSAGRLRQENTGCTFSGKSFSWREIGDLSPVPGWLFHYVPGIVEKRPLESVHATPRQSRTLNINEMATSLRSWL